MELNNKLQAAIVEIFRKTEYGRITFFVSPEKKTLDYSVETTGKLQLQPDQGSQRVSPTSQTPRKNI
jgi:hypothetical protein